MSRRVGRWRRLLLCAVLQFGAFAGIPMRPDEVVRLMQNLSRPRAEQVDPDESERGDDLPPRGPTFPP